MAVPAAQHGVGPKVVAGSSCFAVGDVHLKLYKVVLPVSDIDQAETFYGQLLAMPGRRVSGDCHHFDCGGIALCCQDLRAEGDSSDVPSFHQVCLVVADLEAVFLRAKNAHCRSLEEIVTQPWGDCSFVAEDPFKNSIIFVDEATKKQRRDEQFTAGPDDHLKARSALSIQSAEGESETRLIASVSKIFKDEVWLKFADSPSDPLFKVGDQVRIQYFDESGAYYSDTEIVKTPSGNEYVAISIPEKAQALRRRAAPRVRSAIPVSFSAFAPSEREAVLDEVFRSQSQDISTTGMRFETEAALKKGDRLRLTLKLPSSDQVIASAEVVRTQPVKGDGKDLTAAGVKFLEMKLEDQIKLLEFLIDEAKD